MELSPVATNIIVDTDILIDCGRGVAEAVNWLQMAETKHTVATTVVTQMELLVGCRNKSELRSVMKFLTRFLVIQLNEGISQQAVKLLIDYRLSHGLLIADALIAAAAMNLGWSLVSKNQRDYRFIAGLDLQPYP